MASFSVLVRAFFCAILSIISPVLSHVDRSQFVCRDRSSLACEVHNMKLTIAHLESVLGERIQSSFTKNSHLEEKRKLIDEMTNKINFLQTSLREMKGGSTNAEENVNKLEEDVQLLWAASRKNNFDIHILESKVQDAKVRLESLTSQVEKMTNISTELWIQIRHLEQALQMTKNRILKAQRRSTFTTSTFLEAMKDFLGRYCSRVKLVLDPLFFGQESFLTTYLAQALHQFRKIMSAARDHHYELQEIIKKHLERNEFTAALANKEVVFFLASAVVTFPTLVTMKFLFAII